MKTRTIQLRIGLRDAYERIIPEYSDKSRLSRKIEKMGKRQESRHMKIVFERII